MRLILIYFTIFLYCNALEFEMRDVLNYSKLKVKNWKVLRDKDVVKQSFDYSCGASSLATLLNNFYGSNVSEKEILSAINTNFMASFNDMRRILPNFGFQAKGYELGFDELLKLKIPVIVYLKFRKSEHFSVLKGIGKNMVVLSDPSLGNVSFSKKQFLDMYNTTNEGGKILAVLPLSNHQKLRINDNFFLKNPKSKSSFTLKNIKFFDKL